MLKIGDVVVTMSYPGLFTVLALENDVATIENDRTGILKVHASNLRRVRGDESAPS